MTNDDLIRPGLMAHIVGNANRSIESCRHIFGVSPPMMKNLSRGVSPFTYLKIQNIAEAAQLDAATLESELKRFSDLDIRIQVHMGDAVSHPTLGDGIVLEYAQGLAKVRFQSGAVISGIDTIAFVSSEKLGLKLMTIDRDALKSVPAKPYWDGVSDIDPPESASSPRKKGVSLGGSLPPVPSLETTSEEGAEKITHEKAENQVMTGVVPDAEPNAEIDLADNIGADDAVVPDILSPEAISRLVEVSGMSMTALSKSLGMHVSFIQGLKRGRKFPADMLDPICRVTGLDKGKLLDILLLGQNAKGKITPGLDSVKETQRAAPAESDISMSNASDHPGKNGKIEEKDGLRNGADRKTSEDSIETLRAPQEKILSQLIEAIQSQNERIDRLEAQIERLATEGVPAQIDLSNLLKQMGDADMRSLTLGMARILVSQETVN